MTLGGVFGAKFSPYEISVFSPNPTFSKVVGLGFFAHVKKIIHD